MTKCKFLIYALGLLASATTLQSCLDDDNDKNGLYLPTAIVTVQPMDDGTFQMYLDNNTVLSPSNVKKSPYGDKEVRALVNYYDESPLGYGSDIRSVKLNWIDSIRTKMPIVIDQPEDISEFQNDPVEIVKDWVTVAEDGYITLRVRTTWGPSNKPHYIDLISGTNPNDPYEVELRHDAKGDVGGRIGDGLIAFNLNKLPHHDTKMKIKLKWQSFSGPKSAEFDLDMREVTHDPDMNNARNLMPLK